MKWADGEAFWGLVRERVRTLDDESGDSRIRDAMYKVSLAGREGPLLLWYGGVAYVSTDSKHCLVYTISSSTDAAGTWKSALEYTLGGHPVVETKQVPGAGRPLHKSTIDQMPNLIRS